MSNDYRDEMTIDNICMGFRLLGLDDAINDIDEHQKMQIERFDIYTNLKPALTTSYSHTGCIANA